MSEQKYVITHGPVPEYLAAGKVYPVTKPDIDGDYWIKDDYGQHRMIWGDTLNRYGIQFAFCDQHGNPVAERGACASCNGSGSFTALDTSRGPDGEDVDAPCSACCGTGGADGIGPVSQGLLSDLERVEKQRDEFRTERDRYKALAGELAEALRDAHAAITFLPPDALGSVPDKPDCQGWFVRDELIHHINQALAKYEQEKGV